MIRRSLPLILITLLGLGLRLLAWDWHELYPLGGDEQEYFAQALALARGEGYHELLFMRPPLYGVLMAAWAIITDSSVQGMRLIQALISTATIPLTYAWAHALTSPVLPAAAARRSALCAAALAALSYTLALNATELLTETTFLFGLTFALWMLALARTSRRRSLAFVAGLSLGALCLLRSVALPLVVLGAAWMWWRIPSPRATRDPLPHSPSPRAARDPLPHSPSPRAARDPLPLRGEGTNGGELKPPLPAKEGEGVGGEGISTTTEKPLSRGRERGWGEGILPALLILGALAAILPWTARNAMTYGGFILIDTTGQENLWLDNEPQGREFAKRQLYAMGEQRIERARLATERGLENITAHPGFVAEKGWRELRRFFALEHADDMLARPGIWVRPAEVWLRLLLGDGLWLVLLLAGVAGLALGPWGPGRWTLALWLLYLLFTAALFHTELRYRLPAYPALLPAAGWLLARFPSPRAARDPQHHSPSPLTPLPQAGEEDHASPPLPLAGEGRVRGILAALLTLGAVALTLSHASYLPLAARLAEKHLALYQARAALDGGDPERGATIARDALVSSPNSALLRVVAAEGHLELGRRDEAEQLLRAAIAAQPAHPYAHLLLGDLLRARGEDEAARAALAYERASLEDLQRWAQRRFDSSPPASIDIGGGLDLGWIAGFHLAEHGARWTKGAGSITLARPPDGGTVTLRIRAPLPEGARRIVGHIDVDGHLSTDIPLTAEWQTVELQLPPGDDPATITIRSRTVVPHAIDSASPDGRALGVEVDEATVRPHQP